MLRVILVVSRPGFLLQLHGQAHLQMETMSVLKLKWEDKKGLV